MQKIKTKTKNLAEPGNPMSEDEFLALIREAEKGPFKPVANLKKEMLAVWKKKYAK